MQIAILSIFFVLALVISILIYISNNCLKVTKYTIANSKIPKSFDKLKIVHISDVHCKTFGKDNEIFINKVKELNPDIIVMSGDIIDGMCKDVDGFVDKFKKLYESYPTFYCIGNHEAKLRDSKYEYYLGLLKKCGVNVIIDDGIYYYKNEDKIKISSLKFTEEIYKGEIESYLKYMRNVLKDINEEEFNILIAHDPENFEEYAKLKADLIFSGHVHGGLIRFGRFCLFSPRRRFFPKYSYGKSELNKTTMITSSGIGNASIPIRLFNRPEIVLVTLCKK